MFKYKTLAVNVFNRIQTYSVEYASDPRFKIQGARENFALHLES